MSYTCPVCWRTSYHPDDEKYSYCGNCHDFTGGYGYGNERYSSSRSPAGSEGKMRMPTNDEDGKAQPEMPEVQGEGDCPGLLSLRRERVERDKEPIMRTLQRIGLCGDLMMTSYENMRRLTKVERWLFASVGLTCGISLTNLLHVLMTTHHVLLLTTGIIVFVFVGQMVYCYRGMRRLKAGKQELDAQTESFKKRYGLTDKD
jgi:hypothetical protein